MMSLGVDGVFVGSGIFKSSGPEAYARAIVEATPPAGVLPAAGRGGR